MELIKAKTKAEVEALKECFDLIHNGYFILWSAGKQGDMWMKFKHSRNGNILSINVRYDGYDICKMGKKIKSVSMPVELISN